MDQQMPEWVRAFEPEDAPCTAKVFLFDPCYRHQPPLAITHQDSSEVKKWQVLNYNQFVKGNLMVTVSNAWFERKSKFFTKMVDYVKELLLSGGFIALGIFTQPYCRVEENNDAIDFYNSVIADPLILQANKHLNFLYYHLADYGTRTPAHRTRVWYMRGTPHDQDTAVVKEVARYKGLGINFGVESYGLFPGRRFSLFRPAPGPQGAVPQPPREAKERDIDYAWIQEQVERAEGQAGTQAVLEEQECYVHQIGISVAMSLVG